MSKHQLTLRDQTTEFLLYTAPNGAIKVEVLLSNESIWLTQKRMAELFGVGVPAISKHLKNIFDSGELVEGVVISVLETTPAQRCQTPSGWATARTSAMIPVWMSVLPMAAQR